MNLPAFQFDPEAARFGTARSQKRVEDARLARRSRASTATTARFAGEVWLVVVRSPHAHARLVSIDTSAAASSPGVACGVDDGGPEGRRRRRDPRFHRSSSARDGSPMAIAAALRRWPTTRYATSAQPVAAVVAATRRQAQDAAELVARRLRGAHLPWSTDARCASRRTRRSFGSRRPATSPPRHATAIPERSTRPSRERRMSSRSACTTSD